MPGFLSSLLSIGGTIVGNMILPGIGGAIGGALGGAVGGAIDGGGDSPQAQASSSAADAQIAAQREAIAARQLAAGQVATFEEPFLRNGYGANNALSSRLGLPSVAGYVPASNPLIPGGGTNALTGNPLASTPVGTAASVGGTNPITMPGEVNVTTDGGGTQVLPGSGSAAPTSQVPFDPTNTDAFPMPTGSNNPPGQTNALTGQPVGSPSAGAPISSGIDPGTYGSTANPAEPGAYKAPTPYSFSYGLDDYKASPAYGYQQDQARKATLAGASATGALQSGAAMKALQDRAQNIALLDFTNERNFAQGNALQTHSTNTADAINTYGLDRNAYTNDRDYLTGRFDTQTNNLFRLSGQGQQAATTDANAAVGAGTGIAAADTAIGDARAGNALQQGNIASNNSNNLGGLITSAYQNFAGGAGGAGTPLNVQSAPMNALTLAPGQVPQSLNFLPPVTYNFG